MIHPAKLIRLLILPLSVLAFPVQSATAPLLSNPDTTPESPLGPEYHGAVGGKASVSAAGNAAYSLPLALPPGTGGMAPRLSLGYNSNIKSGLVGLGWFLRGGVSSKITRCAQNLSQDGQIRAIDYSSDDRFCLDGQRLVAVLGTYGDPGTEYRTEIDSFRRIYSQGKVSGGPEYFTVESPNGHTSYFGNTDDSRIEAQGKSKVASWALNRVEDESGNYFSVNYSENNTKGTFRPKELWFTGNDLQGLAPYVRVHFEYESRTDSPFFYRGGSRVREFQKRLESIAIHVDNNLVTDYQLVYEEFGVDDDNIPIGSQSRLKTIKRCDAFGLCQKDLNIDWWADDNGVGVTQYDLTVPADTTNLYQKWRYPRWHDLNGDGIADYVHTEQSGTGDWVNQKITGNYEVMLSGPGPYTTSTWTTGINPHGRFDQIIWADIDGDDRTDMITPTSGSNQTDFQIAFSTGTAFNVQTWLGYTKALDGEDHYFYDMNGDKRLDLVVKEWTRVYRDYTDCNAQQQQNYDYDYTIKVGLNTGGSFGTLQTWITGIEKNADLADMNGDGLIDLISETRYVHFNNGSGFEPIDDFNSFGEQVCNNPFTYIAEFGDYNGDGLADRVIKGDVQYNTGTKFVTAGTPLMAPIVDINGDGKRDGIARTFTAVGNNYKYTDVALRFLRDYFGSAYKVKHLSNDEDLNHFQQLADLNGDGIFEYTANVTDYCVPSSDPTAAYCETDTIRVYKSEDPPHHLLKKITTGLGHEVEFTYRPLTDYSIYTKHSTGTLPIVDVQDSTHVVTGFTQSDGSGGSITTNYTYEGLKRDYGGRGILGFARITATNATTDTTTISLYEQAFPIASQRKWREVRQTSTNQLLGTTETFFQHMGTIGSGPVITYVDNRIAKAYNLNDGRLLTTTTTTNIVDAYGNITDSTTHLDDAENGATYQTQVQRVYTHDTANWRVKQLDTQTVKSSLNGTQDASKDRVSQYVYFPGSGLLKDIVSEPGGGNEFELTQRYSYDGYGNVDGVEAFGPGINLRSASILFDSRGQFPVTLTNPFNHTVARTWDSAFGSKLTETGPNNQITMWSYDTFGRQWQETRADNTFTQSKHYEDQSGSNLTAVMYTERVTSGAPVARVFRDLLGRTVRQRSQGFDGSYLNIDAEYDVRGRVLQTSEPYFDGDSVFWNSNTYDQLNRLLGAVRADSTADRIYTYDGALYTSWDANLRTTKQWKNAVGQVVLAEDEAGTQTQFHYDAAGNRTSVVNDLGGLQQNTVSYTRDKLGRIILESDPNRGSNSYGYNALGQVVSEQSPKLAAMSQSITALYDDLGRIVSRTEPEGTTTWSYDNTSAGNLGIGKLHNESQAGFDRTYHYDAGDYGRVTGSTTVIDGTSSYSTSIAYTADGKVESETYPSNFQIHYRYNGLGYLERIQDDASGTSVYYQLTAADANGRVKQEWLGDGSLTDVGYEGQSGRVTDLHTTNGAQDIQHFSYAYDSVGNMSSRSDQVNTLSETFTFDNLDRLLTAQVAGSAIVGYNYDPIGNITDKGDRGNPYLYNSTAIHAVTDIGLDLPPGCGVGGAGSVQYLSYDANGNFINGGGEPAITWSSYNKPTHLSKNGITYGFSYGPDRLRYKKVKGAAKTHYIGNAYEKTETGALWDERHMVRAYGRTIMLRKTTNGTNAANQYVHQDHLGSITALTQESDGSVIERFSYDAWGKRRAASDWVSVAQASGEVRGYTGHEHLDDIGIIHMNGRVYSPGLGKMLSPDPVTQAPNSGRNYNRYTYAFNNPLRYTDPSGYAGAGLIEEILVTAPWIPSFFPSFFQDFSARFGSIPGFQNFFPFVSDPGVVAPEPESEPVTEPEPEPGDDTTDGDGDPVAPPIAVPPVLPPAPAPVPAPAPAPPTSSGGNGVSVADSIGKWLGSLTVAGGALEAVGGSAGITNVSGDFRHYPNGWLGNQFISTYDLGKLGKALGGLGFGAGFALDAQRFSSGEISSDRFILNTTMGLLGFTPALPVSISYNLTESFGPQVGGGAIDLLMQGQQPGIFDAMTFQSISQ